jgi:hypothetical protein
MLRVLRSDGIVMLAVPDKRFTFDKDRAITTNEHILMECLNGTEGTREGHFADVVGLDRHPERKVELEAEKKRLMDMDYSIHYHVWDSDAFLKFLLWVKEYFQLPFELLATFRNGEETIHILKKIIPGSVPGKDMKII